MASSEVRPKPREWVDVITCRLCGCKFGRISPTHLREKHGFLDPHPILEYRRRFALLRSESIATAERRRQAFQRQDARVARFWSRPRVLRELRSFFRRHGRTPQKELANERPQGYPSLLAGIYRHFRTLPEARKAAGLPEFIQVPWNKKWTRPRILEEIRSRASRDLPINSVRILKEDGALWNRARLEFGSWPEAVKAAGCVYPARRFFRKWTRESILEEIKRRAKAGLPVRGVKLKDTTGLFNAARPIFGSWRRALEDAGLDGSPPRKWTRQSILDAIRACGAKLESIQGRASDREAKRLVGAARYEFGSWRKATRAAGLVFPLPRRLWTREKILEVIHETAQKGMSIAGIRIRSQFGGIVAGARREFGSWRAALRAAGSKVVPPGSRTNMKRMDVPLLISRRIRARQSLRLEDVHLDAPYLAENARRYFGSWEGAVRAAALSPR